MVPRTVLHDARVMYYQRGRDLGVESVGVQRRGHREDPRDCQASPANSILRAGASGDVFTSTDLDGLL